MRGYSRFYSQVNSNDKHFSLLHRVELYVCISLIHSQSAKVRKYYSKLLILLFHPALSCAASSSTLRGSFWQSMRREPVGGDEPPRTYAMKQRFRSLFFPFTLDDREISFCGVALQE